MCEMCWCLLVFQEDFTTFSNHESCWYYTAIVILCQVKFLQSLVLLLWLLSFLRTVKEMQDPVH